MFKKHPEAKIWFAAGIIAVQAVALAVMIAVAIKDLVTDSKDN